MTEAVEGFFLGVDGGSSSTQAVLVGEDGVVAAARPEHGISRPYSGWAEKDVDRDRWGSVVHVCRRTDPDQEAPALYDAYCCAWIHEAGRSTLRVSPAPAACRRGRVRDTSSATRNRAGGTRGGREGRGSP